MIGSSLRNLRLGLLALAIFAPLGVRADRAARVMARIDAVSCADLFETGAPDFTRAAQKTGRGLAAWLRYLGDLVQTKHDRRAWAITQKQLVDRWDSFYAAEIIGAAWSPDYAAARDALDARAREWIGVSSPNPDAVVRGFRRYQTAMRELKIENAEVLAQAESARARRDVDLRTNESSDPARVRDFLARVTPVGAARPPADFDRRLRVDRRLRRLVSLEIQALRRSPSEVGRRRLAVTYALLEHEIEPDDIRATRAALPALGMGKARARAELMDEIARVPFMNRVVRMAAVGDGPARWAYLIYLAYRMPHLLPRPPDADELIRIGRDVISRQDLEDVEQIITDVIMTTGESETLRAGLKVTLTLLPRLMDPDARPDHPPVPDDEALASYFKLNSLKP